MDDDLGPLDSLASDSLGYTFTFRHDLKVNLPLAFGDHAQIRCTFN
jgi:hypothetical protein